MGIGISFGILLCSGIAVTNVIQFAYWFAAVKKRSQPRAECQDGESVQRDSLDQLARMVTVRRFELDWILCTLHRSDSLICVAELLRQQIPENEFLFVAGIDTSGELIDATPLHLRGLVHLTDSGFRELSQSKPVLLQTEQRHVHIIGQEEIQQAWAIPCQANNDQAGWLLLSRIPELTGNADADLALIMKLCRSLTLPPKETSTSEDLTERTEQEEIRLVRDMLQLRTVSDEEYSSPHEMLQEFLRKLAYLTGVERASLYQRESPRSESWDRISWGGGSVPANLSEDWDRTEQSLLTRFPARSRGHWINSTELGEANRPGGIRFCSVLIVPLSDSRFAGGVLMLTSRKICGQQRLIDELTAWAAEFLPTSFSKALRRQVVEEHARRDGLTRLANRLTFDQELAKHCLTHQQLITPLSLLLIDIDHFKSINDRFGHLAGDDVLKQIAQDISQTAQQQRITDRPLVARFGGEEFAVILPDCSASGAARIAEEIRLKIDSCLCWCDGHTVKVTVSIGVATCDDSLREPAELIRKADEALYLAKKMGRNRVVHTENESSVIPRKIAIHSSPVD